MNPTRFPKMVLGRNLAKKRTGLYATKDGENLIGKKHQSKGQQKKRLPKGVGPEDSVKKSLKAGKRTTPFQVVKKQKRAEYYRTRV